MEGKTEGWGGTTKDGRRRIVMVSGEGCKTIEKIGRMRLLEW